MEKQTKKHIDEYLKTHGGVIRTSDFQKAGFHNTYLSELTKKGYIVRLKAGLYIAAESQTDSGFYEIQLALPNAVICLASALTFYEMSIYEPSSVHIALPRDERVLPPDFPPTRRFSFGNARYELGLKQEQIEGHPIQIYDREKTICDIISYRRVLGQDITNEAVRNYLATPGRNLDLLLEYSRLLRVEGPVEQHLRLMT
jgi:predicted transcriptional regulator of viral defense system